VIGELEYQMKLNDWEHRPTNFLSNSFGDDVSDIVDSLTATSPSVVMELGFGNNRLLPHILNALYPITYYGFDKTKTFVNRAKQKFDLPHVHFGRLNIENLSSLGNIVGEVSPDILILRHIIEHIPSWRLVLTTINSFMISDILISLHNEAPKKASWSMIKFRGKGSHRYTLNYIHSDDLCILLNSYTCIKDISYSGCPHRFKHFELIK